MSNSAKCPDCNGRGDYLCCNGFVEQCNNCLSTGRVAAIAMAARQGEDVQQASREAQQRGPQGIAKDKPA